MNAVGQPTSRVDGRRTVTGGARYTAEVSFPGAVRAAIVHKRIGNGRTVSIDTTAADDGSSGSDRRDDRSRRQPRRRTDRHPPRQRQPDVVVRRLRRIVEKTL